MMTTPQIILTPAARANVRRVASYYRAIKRQYLQNSVEHVLHHFSFMPASLVFFAVGTATPDDVDQLIKLGYAERAA